MNNAPVQLVVTLLGAFLLIVAAGAVLLTALGREMPQGLVALGSVALGALVGILSPNRGGPPDPPPVTVTVKP